MEQLEVLDLMKKYNQMDMKKIKFNLQVACASKYKEYGGREGMAQKLHMNPNSFATCINPSQASILTFENLIKICVEFDIDVNKILNPNTKIIKSAKGQKKFWDAKKIREYLRTYNQYGVEEVMKKYNLSHKTALLYYNRFKEE